MNHLGRYVGAGNIEEATARGNLLVCGDISDDKILAPYVSVVTRSGKSFLKISELPILSVLPAPSPTFVPDPPVRPRFAFKKPNVPMEPTPDPFHPFLVPSTPMSAEVLSEQGSKSVKKTADLDCPMILIHQDQPDSNLDQDSPESRPFLSRTLSQSIFQ